MHCKRPDLTNINAIDSAILERFVSSFWGYGSFEAPFWIVGMEEACGDNELPLRIETWHRRGESPLEDAAQYHNDIGSPDLFKPNAKLQRTWLKLIKAYLAAHGLSTENAEARKFQIEKLGRRAQSEKQTCFIELMPLPSPSTTKWPIKKHTDIEHLQSRDAYMKMIMPKRIQSLQNIIDDFQPKAILFYGLSYINHWEAISRRSSGLEEKDKPRHWRVNNTEFFAMPHPVARGVTNDEFIAVGNMVRQCILASEAGVSA